MTTTTSSSLHKKLASLRASFGPLAKTGTNTGTGGGYKFVEATEVAKRFVELASELNLTMLAVDGQVLDRYPSRSEKQWVIDVKMIYRITDADSGETIDVVGFGQGADNADKALPKAQTNAMKYAIVAGVLQAAGDDPESDGNTDRLEASGRTPRGLEATGGHAVVAQTPEDRGAAKPSAALVRKLMATFREKNLTAAEIRQAYTKSITGKSSSKDLTVADVEKLLVSLADFVGMVS